MQIVARAKSVATTGYVQVSGRRLEANVSLYICVLNQTFYSCNRYVLLRLLRSRIHINKWSRRPFGCSRQSPFSCDPRETFDRERESTSSARTTATRPPHTAASGGFGERKGTTGKLGKRGIFLGARQGTVRWVPGMGKNAWQGRRFKLIGRCFRARHY